MVQRAQYCLEHDRVVSSTKKIFRARDAVEYSNIHRNKVIFNQLVGTSAIHTRMNVLLIPSTSILYSY